MSNQDWPLYPQAFLGILGGGQLGRYFVQAAQDLGYQVCVLDPDPNSPAGQIAQEHLLAQYDDEDALRHMAQLCSAISTEFENVPASTIDFLIQEGVFVAPKSFAVSIAQNRIKEKAFLQSCEALMGIGPVQYACIENKPDIDSVADTLFPGILKTAQLGYDGKGQQTVHHVEELQKAWEILGKVPCVLEKKLDLAFELSALIVRGHDDEVQILPIAQNIHKQGILHLSMVPAPDLNEQLQQHIQVAAQTIIRQLEYVGVLCIEFFVLQDGRLVVNEIAPRPHNSGHHSLDSCLTSQFEQQVRTLAKLPLGDSRLLSPAVMLNILGDVWIDEASSTTSAPPWEKILTMPSAKLHLYGKSEPKKGRKMGHINFLAASVEEALENANQAMVMLDIQPSRK
jgi:5-(carboxyamino)imidazole ribonucleotide synthase